nr:unnamed protein product [Callosobruchus analis]
MPFEGGIEKSCSIITLHLFLLTVFQFGHYVASAANSLISTSERDGPCEEITIPMCLGIGYNMTRMPNELNHESQEEAGMEVHQVVRYCAWTNPVTRAQLKHPRQVKARVGNPVSPVQKTAQATPETR